MDVREHPEQQQRMCILPAMAVCWLLWAIAPLAVMAQAPNDGKAAGAVDYLKQVKPLLRERCYACHGPLKQKAGLRLDTAALAIKGGDSGPAVKAGDVTGSLLLERVSAADVTERMPPENEGEPLSPAQIAVLRDWIAAGASRPPDETPEADPREHWAFRPIRRPAVPQVRSGDWVKNPIDAFVARQHEQHGLTPQPAASRAMLLRRLSLDLVGLPPTLEEIAAFQADQTEGWYERAVQRLLADPRHGERWARHWMDIWRYSDWWGLGGELRNSQKHIWHWRDWIVESLNHDTPYDEMVRLMLAADEFFPNDLDKLRATGFLARNYFLFNRPQWMDETVEHVSKGFLGLTMNCTRCHDHKYDPLPQTDYYRLRAFFEPYHARLDVVPGEANLERDGIPRVFDARLDEPTYVYIRGDEKNPDKSRVMAPGVPALLEFDKLEIKPVDLPVEAWQPQRRAWVVEGYIAAAKQKVPAAEKALAAAGQKVSEAEAAKQGQVLNQGYGQEKRVPSPLMGEAQDGGGESALARRDALPLTPDPSPARGEGRILDSRRDSRCVVVAAGASPLSQEVEAAQAEHHVAEAALAVARAELNAVEQRAKAWQAVWNEAAAEVQSPLQISAVRAERELSVETARHAMAIAERDLRRAAQDKKEAAEKTVQSAKEALDKATAAAAAEVQPTDKVSEFVGAKWTPTRFLSSGGDDPAPGFSPRSTGRRSALARWIADRRNPLTARVAVNHLWTRHFGTPLVATVFDFGRKGQPPTHPELLDWLASEFIDSGWSMKHVHRLIVQSATYRLSSSSSGADANVAKDPDNVHLWRRTPSRLESQAVRDSLLALAGMLDPTRGGPPVPQAQQADSKRRSLYFFHSNNERNLFLTMFDEALVTDCYRRDQSIIPQQALAMTNSQLVLDLSRPIAERIAKYLMTSSQPADSDEAFIRAAFLMLLVSDPTATELAASSRSLDAWRKLPEAGQGDAAIGFARANLVWVLLNHNDFITLR